MEQHLAAADWKGQIAEFVEDHEIDADEVVGKAPRLSGPGFGLELISSGCALSRA